MLMNIKKIISTDHSGYNQSRNFYKLPFKKFQMVKSFNWFKLLDHFNFKVFKKNHLLFHNLHFDLFLNRNIKLNHFFNTISISKRPWIVTAEGMLPKFKNTELGLRKLANPSCKKIICMTERALKIQNFYLDKYPKYKKVIQSKTIVKQPPQELRVNDISSKKQNEVVTFSSVGYTFFRKGGKEILASAKRLKQEGYKFKINIVTNFEYGVYKDHHITEKDVKTAKKNIEELGPYVNYYEKLSNEDVLKMFADSDVALLPSYGETYGYVVLEAQANACPAITTNMPPFEEFNNNTKGWLVDVPLISERGIMVSDSSSIDTIIAFSEALEENLYLTMKSILDNPKVIKEKAQEAINHIKNNHDIDKMVDFLEDIYSEALSS